MTNAKFSTASDVWSYGISIWEIYSLGRTPWKGLGPIEIRDKIMEGERLEHPERCPEEVFDVMRACWKKEPQERPTFTDIQKRVQQVRGPHWTMMYTVLLWTLIQRPSKCPDYSGTSE